MATSFGDLKAAIIRLLGDEVTQTENTIAGRDSSADLLRDAVRAGLLAILPHAWKSAVYAIPEATTELDLPTDLYHVEGIYDIEQEAYLEESILTPGIPTASESGNMWIEYPEGHITFLAEVEDGGTLYYAAYWTEPELDADIIEAPAMAMAGIAFFAASYCLLPQAVGASKIRQYDTKVDSGTPEDNPVMTMANHYLKRFELEMSRISGRVKGVR
jgi:hypothetical protein